MARCRCRQTDMQHLTYGREVWDSKGGLGPVVVHALVDLRPGAGFHPDGLAPASVSSRA
jgi:hypothetical protein